MKTTKRSKMLLSSIAMLLVALVALGSATFAWYSINRTVTASEMTVKASTVGGLLITSTETTKVKNVVADNYGTAVEYDLTETLYPAWLSSFSAGTATMKTYEHNDGSTVAKTDVATSALSDTDSNYTYVVVKDLTLKNTNNLTGTVTPTLTVDQVSGSYIRAVLYKADGTVLATTTSDTAATSTNAPTAAASNTITLAKNATQQCYIVIYAEGYNSNCTAANANDATKNADVDVAVSFTMADA